MRLFIAIELPTEVRHRLAAACAPFQSLAENATWTRSDQLHLTLAFIGDAAPTFLPHLENTLDSACAAVPAFACRATGFGFFGSRRNPTVLWAGVEPADRLEEIHEHLWHALEPLGYEKPSSRFHAHLTLARCRERSKNKAVLDAMDETDATDFGAWTPPSITLFESRQKQRGVEYRPVHRAAFADA